MLYLFLKIIGLLLVGKSLFDIGCVFFLALKVAGKKSPCCGDQIEIVLPRFFFQTRALTFCVGLIFLIII